MQDNPKPHEEVCFNCRHMVWAVGIGQGVRCSHPDNEVDGKVFRIPSRHHTCEHFERKARVTQGD